MSKQATYLDLKGKLRSQTNSYDELKSFLSKNTELDMNTVKHNEILKTKDGSFVLVSDLDTLTKTFIPIKLRRQLPKRDYMSQQVNNKFKMEF